MCELSMPYGSVMDTINLLADSQNFQVADKSKALSLSLDE